MAEGDVAMITEEGAKEELTLMEALKQVLKKAQIHDGLARGIRESVKALDRRQAYFCVLAEDCDEKSYKQLIEALCAQHGIDLIKVPSKQQLGEWVGIARYDKDMALKKSVKCSSCVVKDFGEESPALNVILEHFKKQ
eukprot:GEZU01029404.1.p2 GENE.GEZU01029404.1~~GEZU01029404.1.p2  ORF type:complete len:138 (-),score=67.67 GEZU01029404.1:183-596(-)